MESTPLEKALEKYLGILGQDLSGRVFKEDVKAAAEVDDLETPRETGLEGEERLLYNIFKLSNIQTSVTARGGALFSRAAVYSEIAIRYCVNIYDDTPSSPKSIIDRIISEKRFDDEEIWVWHQMGDMPASDIAYGDCPGIDLFILIVQPDGTVKVDYDIEPKDMISKKAYDVFYPQVVKLAKAFGDRYVEPDDLASELIRFMVANKEPIR